VGRMLTAQDCESGAAPVVVLSHAFWLASYGGDASIVGSGITMNDQSFTVVGVAARDAHEPGLQRLDYYVPITAQLRLRPDRQWLISNELGWLELMGRRKEGSTLERLRAEFTAIAAEIDAGTPGRSTAVFVERATATSIRKLGQDSVSAGALVFLSFGLVLLIACANVANLFLARALTYTPAIAVRRALGASRARIVRQLLIESLLIAAAGGIVGSIAAVVSFKSLLSVLAASSSLALPEIELDFVVLLFALALSLGAGIGCGLWPALRASQPDLHAAAKRATLGIGGGREGRIRSALIAAQVAACAVLLIGAALLLRGLYATHTVDPGFPYHSVAYSSFELRGLGYERSDIATFQRRLVDDISAIPSVAAVGFAADPPLGGSNMSMRLRLPGEDVAAGRVARRNMVTPGYFAAAGIPVVRGRTFTEAEQTGTSAVLIVTESTARNLWPDREAIGQTLVSRAGADEEARWEVVGVARDAQIAVIGQTEPYYVYEPIPPQFQHQLKLIVRSKTDAAAVLPQVRSAVQSLEPRLAFEVTSVESNIEAWQRRAALVTSLALVVGLLALGLAAVGIYGVVAYVVARRAHEIGLRMALGAESARIMRQILMQAMRPVAAGALVGIVTAVATSKLLSAVLFGISPLDLVSIGSAVAFLLGVAMLASLPPARRALRASPMATMRHE
jgi:predicted permease